MQQQYNGREQLAELCVGVVLPTGGRPQHPFSLAARSLLLCPPLGTNASKQILSRWPSPCFGDRKPATRHQLHQLPRRPQVLTNIAGVHSVFPLDREDLPAVQRSWLEHAKQLQTKREEAKDSAASGSGRAKLATPRGRGASRRGSAPLSCCQTKMAASVQANHVKLASIGAFQQLSPHRLRLMPDHVSDPSDGTAGEQACADALPAALAPHLVLDVPIPPLARRPVSELPPGAARRSESMPEDLGVDKQTEAGPRALATADRSASDTVMSDTLTVAAADVEPASHAHATALSGLTPFMMSLKFVRQGDGGLQRAFTHVRELLGTQSSQDTLSRLLSAAAGGGAEQAAMAQRLVIVHEQKQDGTDTLALLLSRGLALLQLTSLSVLAISAVVEPSRLSRSEAPMRAEAALEQLDMLEVRVVRLALVEEDATPSSLMEAEAAPESAVSAADIALLDGAAARGSVGAEAASSAKGGTAGAEGGTPGDDGGAAEGDEGDEGGAPSSVAALRGIFERSDDRSLRLLLSSAMPDFAALLLESSELVARKTLELTIVCDVAIEGLAAGVLEPDVAGWQTEHEQQAVRFIIERCQRLGLPLVILTHSAVAAASIPPFFFDELALTGHPIALRLRATAIKSMSSLWFRACQPADSELRMGLLPQYDRAWFSSSFCGGRTLSHLEADSPIWSHVSEVRIAETLAVLASHPSTLEKFFEVSVCRGQLDVDHLVIHGSDSIFDVQQLRSVLLDCLSYALSSTTWCRRRKDQEKARAARRLNVEQNLLNHGNPPARRPHPPPGAMAVRASQDRASTSDLYDESAPARYRMPSRA